MFGKPKKLVVAVLTAFLVVLIVFFLSPTKTSAQIRFYLFRGCYNQSAEQILLSYSDVNFVDFDEIALREIALNFPKRLLSLYGKVSLRQEGKYSIISFCISESFFNQFAIVNMPNGFPPWYSSQSESPDFHQYDFCEQIAENWYLVKWY